MTDLGEVEPQEKLQCKGLLQENLRVFQDSKMMDTLLIEDWLHPFSGLLLARILPFRSIINLYLGYLRTATLYLHHAEIYRKA